MGIETIVAQAASEEHGEILRLVGATRVVFPKKEAAKRIAPMLFSSLISSYLPISSDFVIAEVKPPLRYIGKSLIESNLRKEYQLNVVAVRKKEGEDFRFFSPEYILSDDDIFLIAGSEKNIVQFAQVEISIPFQNQSRIKGFFKNFYPDLDRYGLHAIKRVRVYPGPLQNPIHHLSPIEFLTFYRLNVPLNPPR